MKKKSNKGIYCFLLFSTIAAFLSLSGCKDNADEMAPPVVTEIRNYAASPDDTVLQTLETGQWVVLLGKNMDNVAQVIFGRVLASINTTLTTGQSIVIQVPSIPFQSVPRDMVNEIILVDKNGKVTTFSINITGTPIISLVRNYEDNVIPERIFPNQKVNIVGFNLKDATKIAFQGVAADLASVVFTDSSAIVQVPANLSGGDASLANSISVTNHAGIGTFSISIVGPPIITSISYEIPKEGDEVYLFGNNFFNIQSITFAGAAISNFEASEGGDSIRFIAPELTQSAPVMMTGDAGTFTTAYNVNDINFINAGGTGILGNIEWGDYFGYQWWGGSVDLYSSDPTSGWPPYNADYGVGTGMYLTYKSNKLNGGAGDDGNAIRIGDYNWVPAGNLGDQGGSWSLKFEIYVKEPWNGGTICIKSTNGSYLALYEPWKISATEAAPYITNGWQTVTIPLSAFRLDNGKGESIKKVSDLLDAVTKKGNLIIYLHNYGTGITATSFIAGFDNFRVVKR